MNPVLIDLQFMKIYWYSLFVMLAFLVGGYIAMREARKNSIDDDYMINFIFFLVPIALLGARIYYIIFNWSYYQSDLIGALKVWEGGLAIHGGIIFGFLWLLFYTRNTGVRTLRFLDIVAPAVLIGQAIGRWGNFFNQEAYGAITTAEKLQSFFIPDFIIEGMLIDGQYHHPTFLYEFLWCVLGFIIILLVRRFSKYLKVGQLTSLFLLWYGTGRYFIEGLRTDSLMFGSIRVAQAFSLVMIFIGITMYFYLKRGSRFDDLYAMEDKTVDRVNKLLDNDTEGDAE